MHCVHASVCFFFLSFHSTKHTKYLYARWYAQHLTYVKPFLFQKEPMQTDRNERTNERANKQMKSAQLKYSTVIITLYINDVKICLCKEQASERVKEASRKMQKKKEKRLNKYKHKYAPCIATTTTTTTNKFSGAHERCCCTFCMLTAQ